MRSIIKEKNLTNKKILLRLDLNVPLERDKIIELEIWTMVYNSIKYSMKG